MNTTNKTYGTNKIQQKRSSKTETYPKSAIISYYTKLAFLCKQISIRGKRRIFTKYRLNQLVYSKNLVNKLIFNEKHRVVAIFKDYLILDDFCDFLKRYVYY